MNQPEKADKRTGEYNDGLARIKFRGRSLKLFQNSQGMVQTHGSAVGVPRFDGLFPRICAESYMVPAILIVCILAVIILVMPVVLRTVLGVKHKVTNSWRDRVELRYQNIGTSVWMFAHFKLRLDAMFRELPEFVKVIPNMRTAMDLGCGHGIAACALLEWIGELKLYGVEPSARRVRAAARAVGERGVVVQAAAPDFEWPGLPDRLDAVFALDMMHFLSDSDFDLTLRRIGARLEDGGYLVIRTTIVPAGLGSWAWHLHKIARKVQGVGAWHRSARQIQDAMTGAGFQITKIQISGGNPELYWFIARVFHNATEGSGAGAEPARREPR
jgi:SAM-dependent methyltransferase